jgi:hypothetical protein
MRTARFALLVFLSLFLAACSSEAPKPSTEAKPAETKPAFQPTFLLGREALQKMYISARSWVADAKPYNLRSIATKEDNGQDGKAGIWSAGFASASRRGVKVYTWSGIKGDAPEPGVSNNSEDTYNPANTSTAVFDLAYLKTDSDAAFKAAEKHGVDKVLKQDKDAKVFYSLNWRPQENRLVWRVAVGEDQSDPKIVVDVDASTGAFMKVEK